MIRSKQKNERIKVRVGKAAVTRKAKTKEAKKPNPLAKHDWVTVKALYMAGMEASDLEKIPECKDIPKSYLAKKIYGEKWPEERRQLRRKTEALVAQTLHDRMSGAAEGHYNFMLKEIDDERLIIAKRIKTTNIKDQQERIDLLIRFEGIVRKTLGLDNMSPTDQNKNSFNTMIVIQQAGLSPVAAGSSSGTMPLLSSQRGSGGLPSAKESHMVLEEVPEFTPARGNIQWAGQTGQEERPTLSPTINLSAADILRNHRMRDGDFRDREIKIEE